MVRDLDWEGGFNIRDLGEMVTTDGRKTRRGAFVRSGSLHKLTDFGWRQLHDHGIRTLIDLRNENERNVESYSAPNADIICLHYALEVEHTAGDAEFWKQWRNLNCTPLYYNAFAKHYPERLAGVISLIADAQPGGVLFHCGIGRDRTGLIALILLKLMGVEDRDIFADFALSRERLRPHWESIGRRNDELEIDKRFDAKKTTASAAVMDALQALDETTSQSIDPSKLSALKSRSLDDLA